MTKPRKSDALEEISKDLDRRHDVAREILGHMEKAVAVYEKDKTGVNLPRCSREHLDYIVKDLRGYVADLHKARCNLPRLLSNETERGD